MPGYCQKPTGAFVHRRTVFPRPELDAGATEGTETASQSADGRGPDEVSITDSIPDVSAGAQDHPTAPVGVCGTGHEELCSAAWSLCPAAWSTWPTTSPAEFSTSGLPEPGAEPPARVSYVIASR